MSKEILFTRDIQNHQGTYIKNQRRILIQPSICHMILIGLGDTIKQKNYGGCGWDHFELYGMKVNPIWVSH